jgi:inhibitor of cysteine peptidase
MRRFASSALIGGLLLMAGCASAPPPARLTVTDAGAGVVTLAPGQELRIELPLNAGTGYGWRLDHEADATVLAGGSSRTTDAALPGGRITTVFSYQAVARGVTALSFTLKRPWMPDAADDTQRVYRVLVR